MDNDRIFVSTSYMGDSAEVSWATASDGIKSRGDEPDWDGDMVILMDGRPVVKFWEGDGDAAVPFVLVLDPARTNGSYATVYESEDIPPFKGAIVAWSGVSA